MLDPIFMSQNYRRIGNKSVIYSIHLNMTNKIKPYVMRYENGNQKMWSMRNIISKWEGFDIFINTLRITTGYFSQSLEMDTNSPFINIWWQTDINCVLYIIVCPRREWLYILMNCVVDLLLHYAVPVESHL